MTILQIKVNLQIFLFIIVFILTHQIEIYGWIMLFAFIHELGHICTGLILKLKPKTLELMPFGVSITFETYEYKKLIETKKILIALAGPLTNLFIALLTYFLHINDNLKQMIIYSNILIAIFNMIPLYPLDGGRILKGIIRLKKTEIKSDEIINKVSNILIILITAISSIIVLYIKNFAIIFILIYLWIMVIKQNKRFKIKKQAYSMLEKNNKCIDI